MKFRIKAIYFFAMRKWTKNYLEKAQELEEFVFQEQKLGAFHKGHHVDGSNERGRFKTRPFYFKFPIR